MRPQILFPLFAPIGSLKGVGPKIEPLVEKVAGPLVRDLIFTLPHGLIRRPPAQAISAVEGEVQTLTVHIEAHLPPARAGLPYRIRTFDDTGFVSLVFFKGGGPHLLRQHPPGAQRVVSGKVERFGVETQIIHPDYILPPERGLEIPEVEAVYPATAGLSSRILRKLALEALERAPELPEWQDPAWVKREGLPTWREALERAHHPQSEADLSPASAARRRLAYDELFAHQLAMAERKAARRRHPGPRASASATADALVAALDRKSVV